MGDTRETGSADLFQGSLWGLWDTLDSVWMGDDNGPAVYEEKTLAQIAAQMVDVQLGQAAMRTEARIYEIQCTRLRDEKETRMTPVVALRRIEDGRV